VTNAAAAAAAAVAVTAVRPVTNYSSTPLIFVSAAAGYTNTVQSIDSII
jgi:hypothetical protein